MEFVPRVNAVCGYNVHCFGGNDGELSVNFSGGASCAPATVTLTGPVNSTLTGVGTVTFTNLVAGTYNILVTDATGCTATAPSVTLIQPSALTANAGPDQAVTYGYGTTCVILNASRSGGISPYVGRWNIGSATGPLVINQSFTQVCPTTTTTYCYTVTDDFGCTFTDCMTVCVTDVRCGTNLSMVNICHFPPSNPGSPQTMCIAQNQVASHLPAHPGDYLGACGSSNCLANKSGEGMGNSAAALDADGSGLTLTAFPNPFGDATTLRVWVAETTQAKIELYSITGELVGTLHSGELQGGKPYDFDFRPSGQSNGIYLLRATTAAGELKVLKLLQEK